jgi:NDP-sugar pyrophosphorylase family protein
MAGSHSVCGILQAGGRGRRMGSVTDKIPKPLLPVGGTPMVERLIRQFARAGVCDITIITGWLGEQIRAHCDAIPDLPTNVRLTYAREEKPLGNFAGVAELSVSSTTALFAFADLVTNMNFAELLSRHVESGADATLASHLERYQVTLGELIVNQQQVTGYIEKPLKQFTICSGVMAFKPRMLKVLERGRPAGLSDFISVSLSNGFQVEHWNHEASFLDVNQTHLLSEANSASWAKEF